MKAEKIEVVKDWSEPKSVRNIQIFLGFANFYRQFIQSFSRIAASLPSILKTTNKPAPNRNDGSRLASSRNNDERSAFEKNDGNGEASRFGDGVEHAKKSGKSKGQKTFKSRKSVKSEKIHQKVGIHLITALRSLERVF